MDGPYARLEIIHADMQQAALLSLTSSPNSKQQEGSAYFHNVGHSYPDMSDVFTYRTPTVPSHRERILAAKSLLAIRISLSSLLEAQSEEIFTNYIARENLIKLRVLTTRFFLHTSNLTLAVSSTSRVPSTILSPSRRTYY